MTRPLLNKAGSSRGPSRVPVVTEERLRWATDRVIDAVRALSRDIDDRALRLAVVSRLVERDEIARVAQAKRTSEGEPIAEPQEEP